ncbi:hypothetical protein PINS_up000852 [Pythium insidiosum]|nr:hypothetical protein PINS_up000852 [Pythium insidiosum]
MQQQLATSDDDAALPFDDVPPAVELHNGATRIGIWDAARRRALPLAAPEHARALVSWLVMAANDAEKERVVAMLATLACEPSNRRVIALAGAIPLVVYMVTTGSPSHKLRAMRTLRNLAVGSPENQLQIVAAGGLKALMTVFTKGNEAEQHEAAVAMGLLVQQREVAMSDDSCAIGESLDVLAASSHSDLQASHAAWLRAKLSYHSIPDDELETLSADIPAIVRLLESANDTHVLRAVAVLRKLARDPENKARIVVAGGIAPLVALLQAPPDRLDSVARTHAAWTLGQVASNAVSATQIVHEGALPSLIELVDSENVREREAAAYALRHLACSSQIRAEIGRRGGISPLTVSIRSRQSSRCERDHALAAIKNLSCQSENQSRVAETGIVPVLLAIIARETIASHVSQAIAVLRNITWLHPGNQELIARHGGIRPLVALLSTGSPAQRVHATAALANMATHCDLQSAILAAGTLPPLIDLLLQRECSSSNGSSVLVEQHEQALLLIRNVVFESPVNQQRVGASGVIPRLVGILRDGVERLKKQAAAALRNLVWCHAANQEYLSDTNGGVAVLVALLSSGTKSQREQAAATLANLAADNRQAQERIVRLGAIEPLVELVARGTEPQQEQAMLAIKNLLFVDGTRVQTAIPGVIPAFVEMMVAGTAAQRQHATWALANLACHATNKTEIVAAGAIRPLVSTLAKGRDTQKQYAAAAIANLASCPEHKMKILAVGGADPLVDLVMRGNPQQKKQAAWALRNISWDCPDGRRAIADAGGIPALVLLMEKGADSHREHAAAAIANLACDSNHQAKIATAGGILSLVSLMVTGTDGQKQQAVWALANLALSAPNRIKIIHAGGVPLLEAIAATGTVEQRRGAEIALSRMANTLARLHDERSASSRALHAAVRQRRGGGGAGGHVNYSRSSVV